jgi:serine/threonine protein kinase
MSDVSQGPGWWRAADLKWYPPELHADYEAPLPPPPKLPPPPTVDAPQPQPAESTDGATPTPQPQKPAKTRQVIQRDKLGSLTKIGQGGQGIVYRAPNVKTKFAASMVYKEYKTQTRAEIDFTALAAMPALVEESLSYAQAERLISIAAWPCALVEDGVTPTGFVMPAIPEEFFIPLTTAKGVSSCTAEFQHLLNHSSIVDARGINIDDAQRYTLLRETASALAFLHKHGVCVGDISPKNLLFSLAPHEAVYFIDCDAMRINGVSALPQVETPGWNTPAGEELATLYTDTYKLGLLALRLLTGDQDTTNPAHLPATTPAQLRQIITDTLTKLARQRPLPEAWTAVLGHAIEQAQHHNKLTAAPVAAAPTPPPIPEVRSRPPAHSTPPVRPSAAPIPTLHSRPPVGPSAPPQIGEPPLRPPGRPLEYPSGPVPAGGKPKPWIWAVVAAIVVLVAAAGITGYLLRKPSTSQPSTASTTTARTTTTPTSAPPVAEAALEGLWLSPDQINTAMGATAMAVEGTFTAMEDDSAHEADKACLPMDSAVEAPAYEGSGASAVRGQGLRELAANGFSHIVFQNVVLFPSAHDADAFFSASAQRWLACSNRQFTITEAGQPDTVWSVGPVSNTNGTLSATKTEVSPQPAINGWGCQRALTVANNVAIDVQTCSGSPSGPAVNIARQIAAKVPR